MSNIIEKTERKLEEARQLNQKSRQLIKESHADSGNSHFPTKTKRQIKAKPKRD
jgi:hypothetical protein